MATTENFYTGNTSTTTFGFTFPILQNSDLKVELDGVIKTENTSGTNNDYSISGTNVVFNSAPGQDVDIHIYRLTDVDSPKAVFAAGSSIRAGDLNNIVDQSIYANQEQQQKIKTSDVRDDAITSAKILDLGVARTNIANDAIDGTKIADDSVDSEHYVDGSVDTQHIANANITTAKLDNNAVTTVKVADGAITSAKLASGTIATGDIADSQITTVKIAADAVTNAKIADDSIDSEHYVDGSIDTAHLADGAVTDVKLAGGALDDRYYTKTLSDARYFNISTGDTIKDGDTFPDNDTTIATTAAINDRIIDLVDDVGGFVPIANETSFPTANPDVNGGAGTIVSVKAASTNLAPSGTTVTIANGRGTGLPVIITGVSATIPSGFGFLVETTTTAHTYAFHRLVPKATEVSGVASVATEVGRLGTAAAVEDMSILGTADTVADMAILGTTDVVADLNTLGTAAVVEDLNILGTADVVSDMNTLGTSANVTAMSTCATNIASINNASANISSANTFGDQYQVASSPPSTDGGGNALAEGDLYFDTTADELKVYNGGSWQGGVTAAGNFASTTGNTFTGSNTYQDNAKAIFGTSNDGLEIYHNGNDSVIDDTGTGNLKIRNGGANKLTVDGAGIIVGGNITVSGTVDGRDLAADGSSLDSIEQGNIGTDVTNGNVKLTPNGTGAVEIKGAGGNDGTLQLNCSQNSHGVKIKSPAHSAAASYILTLPNSIVNNGFLKTDSSGNLSFAAVNTDLSNDSSPQLGGNLASNGNNILMADTDEIRLGTGGDLQLFHDATDSNIYNASGNLRIRAANNLQLETHDGEMQIKCIEDGAVELYHDNNKKFETTSYGVSTDGVLNINGTGDKILIADNGKIAFGGGTDLKIYHNGSHSVIQNDTGTLFSLADNVTFKNNANSETLMTLAADGAAELYHNGNKKLETTSSGATITGTCTATSFSGDGSNLSGIAAFPSGTKMLFQQTSAPTGWTKVTSGVDNKALRVVSGTVGSGGSNAFSNTLASKTITANAANASPTGNITVSDTSATGNVSIDSATTGGSVDSHTLSTNEIPAHTHLLRSNFYQNQNSHRSNGPGWNPGMSQYASSRENASGQYRRRNVMNMYTEESGGSGGHTHGFTGGSHNHNGTLSGTAHNHNASFTGSAHNHSITVSNLDLAVQYLDVIIAAKD